MSEISKSIFAISNNSSVYRLPNNLHILTSHVSCRPSEIRSYQCLWGRSNDHGQAPILILLDRRLRCVGVRSNRDESLDFVATTTYIKYLFNIHGGLFGYRSGYAWYSLIITDLQLRHTYTLHRGLVAWNMIVMQKCIIRRLEWKRENMSLLPMHIVEGHRIHDGLSK